MYSVSDWEEQEEWRLSDLSNSVSPNNAKNTSYKVSCNKLAIDIFKYILVWHKFASLHTY